MTRMADRSERDERTGATDTIPVVDGHDRLWVNADRTVLVRLWRTGTVEVARREDPSHTWGPPVLLDEERNG